MQLQETVQAHELGPDAFRFVQSQLDLGGPLMSALKLSSQGRIWSYLPLAAKAKQSMADFEDGAVFSAEDAYEISQEIIKFIDEFLMEDPLHVVLAEDQFFKINDPPHKNSESLFEYGGKVYHYRTNVDRELGAAAAEVLLTGVSHYPLIIALTICLPDTVLPNRGVLNYALASTLIANAQHIIVGAYDEEGYLIWSRRPAGSLQVRH